MAFQAGINFQPYGSEAATGYFPDNGDAYTLQQNGLTYGWDASIPSSSTFDRGDATAIDQRYDAGIDTAGTNRKWEIVVPNGTYKVRVVAGDANISSGTYKYNVEGTTNFLSGTAGTGAARWVSATANVTVSDGKLTITNGSGATNTKLAFVDITEATAAAANTAPGAPSNLVVTARYSTGIDLRWDDNADNEQFDDGGYHIERKTGSGSWSEVGTTRGNSRFWPNYTNTSGNTTYTFRVRASKLNNSNQAVYSAYSNEFTVTTPSSDAQAPYYGTAWQIPTQIEVEDFDKGLNNAAYYDLGAQNAGGFYRSGNVDIGLLESQNLFYIGWTETGEWQEYTTNIPVIGNYYVDARVSAGGAAGGGTFKVGFTSPSNNPGTGAAGTYQSGNTQVPNTNGFNNYTTVQSGVFNIGAAGTQVMRMLSTGEDPTGKFVGNFDWIKIQRFDTPTALAATPISSGQINLAWTSNASAPAGFVIERKAGSAGTWGTVTTVGGAVTTFQDTGLSASTQYFYRVKAIAGTLATATSGEANATTTAPASTAPNAPSGLTATLSGTQVALAWADNSANETGFILQRSLNGGMWQQLALPIGNSIGYTDTVSSGNAYAYRVAATNSGGTSAWSNVASVGQVTSLTTTPTGDLYVHSGTNANTNFGSATDLWTKGGTSGFERQAFFKFDLSTLTGTLSSVKLRLFGGLTSTESSNLSFAVKPVANTTWSESTTTWNSRPVVTNTTLNAQVITDDTARWYEFDVTSYVQQEIALGHTEAAFAIIGITASAPAFSIASRESAANKPHLLANVSQAAPQATFGNSGAVNEGSTGGVAFTNPTGGTAPYTYSYDFNNDGAYDLIDSGNSGTTVATAYLTDGPAARTIKGRIKDANGLSSEYTTAITVNNVAPTATLNALPSTMTAGTPLTIGAAVADPGVDAITYAWSATVGGTVVATGTSPSFTFTPTSAGTYAVSLTATDDDGASTTSTANISVSASALLTIESPAGALAEGDSRLYEAFLSAGSLSANATFSWTLKQGTNIRAVASTASFNLLFEDGGTYTLSLTVTDGSATYQTSMPIMVAEVAPTIRVAGSNRSVEGEPYTLTLHASDPGADPMTGWQVDWGDGSDLQNVLAGVTTVNHLFTATSTGVRAYAVGSAASNLLPVNVVPKAPTNLAVTPGSIDIALNWSLPSGMETGVRVERRTGNQGQWQTLFTLAPNATGFNDGTAAAGTSYYYRVRALGVADVSAPTPGVRARLNGPPASVPSVNVDVTVVGLSFVPNATGMLVQGSVQTSGSLGGLPVQFDVNSDGNYEGVAYTDRTGAFVIDLADYVSGSATVPLKVRAGKVDSTTGALTFGAPSALAIELEGSVFPNTDPISNAPLLGSAATFTIGSSFKPVIDHLSGDAPTPFHGGQTFGGAFSSYAGRFTRPASASFNTSTIDSNESPTSATSTNSSGTTTTSTVDSSSLQKQFALQSDGSWTYSETYTFNFTALSTFNAAAGAAHWSSTQTQFWSYSFLASGTANTSTFSLDESKLQAFSLDWSEGSGSGHAFTIGDSQQYEFEADGSATGGVTSETSVYLASGEQTTSNIDAPGGGFESKDSTTSNWDYLEQAGGGTGSSQRVYSFDENTSHDYDNKSTYDTISTSKFGGRTEVRDASGTTRLTGESETDVAMSGQYFDYGNGAAYGWTNVDYVADTISDAYDHHGTENTTFADAGAGFSTSGTQDSTSVVHRDRSAERENDARTTFRNNQVADFRNEGTATNATTSNWVTTRAATGQGSASDDVSSSSFNSSRDFTDNGSSSYLYTATGKSRLGSSGMEAVAGSSKATSTMTGTSTWDNADNSASESLIDTISLPENSSSSTELTGNAESTDAGSSDYTAFSESATTVLGAGLTSKSAVTNNHSETTGTLTNDSIFSTASTNSVDPVPGVNVFTTSSATTEQHPASTYTANATFIADALAGTSTDSFVRHETGTTDTEVTSLDTVTRTDLRLFEPSTLSSDSTTTGHSTQAGTVTADTSSVTSVAAGATRWDQSTDTTETGPSFSTTKVIVNSHATTLGSDGFAKTDTSSTWEKTANGALTASSNAQTHSDSSGVTSYSDSNVTNEGTTTTTSDSRTDYEKTFSVAESGSVKAFEKSSKWYAIEAFDGSGTYNDQTVRFAESDGSGYSDSGEVTTGTVNDSGTTETWSDSLAKIKGIQAVGGITTTYGVGGFNTDEYYEHRLGTYTSYATTDASTRNTNGKAASYLITYSEWDDNGDSDWFLKTTADTKIENRATPLKPSDSKTHLGVDNIGNGHYTQHDTSNTYTENGSPLETRTSGNAYQWGDWVTDVKTNTLASGSDDSQKATAFVNSNGWSTSESTENGTGTYSSDMTYNGENNAAGDIVQTVDYSSTSASDVSGTFKAQDHRATDYNRTFTDGTYSYIGADGKPASVATTKHVVSSGTADNSREGTTQNHREEASASHAVGGVTINNSSSSFDTGTGTFKGSQDVKKTVDTDEDSTGNYYHASGVGHETAYTSTDNGTYTYESDIWNAMLTGGKTTQTSYDKYGEKSSYTAAVSADSTADLHRYLNDQTKQYEDVTKDQSIQTNGTTGGWYDHSNEDRYDRYADGTTKVYHQDKQYDEGMTSRQSNTDRQSTSGGNILDETGAATDTWTSVDSTQTETKHTPAEKFTNYNYNDWTTDKAGDTVSNAEAKYHEKTTYTWKDDAEHHYKQFNAGGSAADWTESATGPSNGNENRRSTSDTTYHGTGNGTYIDDSKSKTTDNVVGYNESKAVDDRTGTYTRVVGSTAEAKSQGVAIEDRPGVTGTRSGSSNSSSTYTTVGTNTDKRTYETGITTLFQNPTIKDETVHGEIGTTTWASNASSLGHQVRTEQHNSSARSGTADSTSHSEEGGTDHFNDRVTTTSEYVNGSLTAHTVLETGTGSGNSTWNSGSTEKSEMHSQELVYPGWGIVIGDLEIELVNVTTHNDDSTSDAGSGGYSYNYTWNTDVNPSTGAQTVVGSGTNSLTDVKGDFTESHHARAGGVESTYTSGSVTTKTTEGEAYSMKDVVGDYTTNATYTITKTARGRSVASGSGANNVTQRTTSLKGRSHSQEIDYENFMGGSRDAHDDRTIARISDGTIKDEDIDTTFTVAANGTVDQTVGGNTRADHATGGWVTTVDSSFPRYEVLHGYDDNGDPLEIVIEDEPGYNTRVGTTTYLEGTFTNTDTSADITSGTFARYTREEKGTGEGGVSLASLIFTPSTFEYADDFRSESKTDGTKTNNTFKSSSFREAHGYEYEMESRKADAKSQSLNGAAATWLSYNGSGKNDLIGQPAQSWSHSLNATGNIVGTNGSLGRGTVYAVNTPMARFPHSFGSGGGPGTWAKIKYIEFSTNYDYVYDWLQANAGINIDRVQDQVVDAFETAADGVLGFVDGAVETLNPLGAFNIEVPDLGPVFGHATAYGVGSIAGTVAGVAGSFMIGNVASGTSGLIACGGLLQKAAQVYTTIDTVVGVAAAGTHLAQGNAGWSDALGLAPVAGYVFGKTGKALGILSDNCYVAGTDVMVGNLEGGDNPFSQKDIEDIRVGDLVWSRDENDPDAPLELKPVTEVYRHVAYDLQSLTLTDLDGERQTLDLTDEHPMYVQGQGWTLAVDLKIGDKILSDDGTDLVVTGNTDFKPAGGMAVYNFAVEGDHTYFVNNTDEATAEGESWAWTHNTCTGYNHFFTRSLGSNTPYGHSSLTYLNAAEHTSFHAALKVFLKKAPLPSGKTADLFARNGRSGALIRSLFTPTERQFALRKFYESYAGGAYLPNYLSELAGAMKHGWVR